MCNNIKIYTQKQALSRCNSHNLCIQTSENWLHKKEIGSSQDQRFRLMKQLINHQRHISRQNNFQLRPIQIQNIEGFPKILKIALNRSHIKQNIICCLKKTKGQVKNSQNKTMQNYSTTSLRCQNKTKFQPTFSINTELLVQHILAFSITKSRGHNMQTVINFKEYYFIKDQIFSTTFHKLTVSLMHVIHKNYHCNNIQIGKNMSI